MTVKATRTKSTAYSTTKVSVEKSQQDINKLLEKHGMTGVQHAIKFDSNEINIRFVQIKQGSTKSVSVSLKAGAGKNLKTPQQIEQARKTAYRALFYWLKSQFEAIDFGLFSFEQIFLSHVEWSLPDGTRRTTGEILIPRIQSGNLNLPMLGSGK